MHTTHLRALLSVSVLALVAFSCSDSKFGGGSSAPKPNGKGLPATESERADGNGDGDALGNAAEGDSETEKADEPAMVAGAFLTCSEDPAIPGGSASSVGVGCVVSARGTKQSFTGMSSHKWSLMDIFNQVQQGDFREAEEASPYHATLVVPRAEMRFLRVRLDLQRNGSPASTFVAGITPRASGGEPTPPPSKPEPAMKEFGAAGDFRLGDGRYASGWNRGCLQALQSVELSGRNMILDFDVQSDDAVVGIMLEEMCGVSVSSNWVQVFRDGQKIYETLIPVEAREVAVPGFKAGKGRYQLKVRSLFNQRTKDYDDFVVGKVVFSYSGQLGFGQPRATND